MLEDKNYLFVSGQLVAQMAPFLAPFPCHRFKLQINSSQNNNNNNNNNNILHRASNVLP